MIHHVLTRRATLLGLTGAVTFGGASLAMAAAPTDRRLVVVILRGALDGMAAVVPYGDPDLAAWRGELLPPGPGQADGLLDLGGFFGLHPALAGMHAMYAEGQLLPVHAIAGATRSRSHFEAQDLLEFGADHRMTSGWLNRVAGLIPPPPKSAAGSALAVGSALPILLRGPAPVGSWMPQSFQHPQADLYARIAGLHESDPVTGPAIAAGLRDRGFSDAVLSGAEPANKYAFPALAASAGRLLADATGPRLACLELGGWDTHTYQANRLSGPLKLLDAGLVALKDGMGDAWRQTAVLVITEFGRTVRMNGSKGTDHGTGAVAFLAGGAVAGGRVQADWPGLASGKLFEDRDLQPTADLRSLAKGVLAAQFGLDDAALAKVFPDSSVAASMSRLIRMA
jgi:uncharacterized protein (DUF1501 family)